MLSKKQQNIDDIKDSLIPMLIWCGVICGLIALTNLSTAILLFATCMLIMFIGRVPVKYLAMLILVGILAGGVALKFGVRGETAQEQNIELWSMVRSFHSRRSTDGSRWRQVVCSVKDLATVINGIFYPIRIRILFMPLSLKNME
ncbi:MAG: hypothetical protein WDN75_20875 [Bacteroidota bacterium]